MGIAPAAGDRWAEWRAERNAHPTVVFHCHTLGHEDGGMMGIVQVS